MTAAPPTRGGRGQRQAGPTDGGSAALALRIGAVPYEDRQTVSWLPAGVMLPMDSLAFATAYRRLIASPPEGTPGLTRDAQQSIVCSAAEQAAAACGFSALADTPDSLRTFAAVHGSVLADAQRQHGRGGGGDSRSRYDPARSSGGARSLDERTQLRVALQLLLTAPLLGRRSALALAPFDGTDEHGEAERKAALEQLAQRCAAEGELGLLCSDPSGGSLSFAPLRAIDLNAH